MVTVAASILLANPDIKLEVKISIRDVLKYTKQEEAARTTLAAVATTPTAAAMTPAVAAMTLAASAPTPASPAALPAATVSSPVAPPDPANLTSAQQQSSTEVQNSAEEEKENEKSEGQIQAEDWIERLTMLHTNDGDDDFCEHLPNLTKSTLSWMHWILSESTGTFRESAKASTIKKFEEWIKKPRDQ